MVDHGLVIQTRITPFVKIRICAIDLRARLGSNANSDPRCPMGI